MPRTPTVPAIALLALTPLLAPMLASPAAAQSVRGELVVEGTERPIEGAFVALLDEGGRQVAGALTDAQGRFLIRAPGPGRYRLRAERIGFRATETTPFEVGAGETIRRRLVSAEEAIAMEGVVARAERRCTVRPEVGRATAELWQEARKALAAAAWTEAAGLFRFRIVQYVRELDPQTLTVETEQSRSRSAVNRKPFLTLPPERLAEGGFVQEDAEGRRTYYAPDSGVLFSDPFLDTHCFRIVGSHPEDASLVGLGFEPVDSRDVPEVAGVLWLDRASAELRSLEYRYVGLPFENRGDVLGGRLEFERVPSGAWIVRRWRIRLPMLGRQDAFWENLRDRRRLVVVGVREEGGEVLETMSPFGQTVAAADRATLAGVVYDSLRGRPLADASVYLSGTGHTATTDSAGRFEIAELSDGTFSVAFTHPLLARLGMYPPPRSVEVRAGAVTDVRLGVPGPDAVFDAVCADSAEARGALVVGTVRAGPSGEPVGRASVVAAWSLATPDTAAGRASIGRITRRAVGFADERGRFRMCGEGIDGTVTLSAAAPDGQARGIATVQAGDGFATQDLVLAPPGRARILGRVLDATTDEPIAGVMVRLPGAGRAAVTDEEGRFLLSRVAGGAYDLEIEHIAYGTRTDSVEIADEATLDVVARLTREAIPLEGLEVTAQAREPVEIRARGTRVDMLSAEELNRIRRRITNPVDLVRAIRAPGLSVREVHLSRHAGLPDGICIETNRNRSSDQDECHMVEVYIDGVRMPDPMRMLWMLDVERVESVELLPPLEAGAAYGTGSMYGVLLIETRDGSG